VAIVCAKVRPACLSDLFSCCFAIVMYVSHCEAVSLPFSRDKVIS